MWERREIHTEFWWAKPETDCVDLILSGLMAVKYFLNRLKLGCRMG